MSLTFTTDLEDIEQELIEFLASEYTKGTGIPVHLYSVVNANMSSYNRSLAITDGEQGTLFMEGDGTFKSYGNGNPLPLVRTLSRCGLHLDMQD